jgi:ribosomal protein L11 methylase PrmA
MAIESGGVAGQELSVGRTVHVMKKERNTKMTKLGFTLTFLTVVVCSLVLGGCDRATEQEARAEAAAARAAMAKAQVAFAKSEKENNKLKSELAAVIQERDDLQEQAKELTKERDEAVAKAKAPQTTTISEKENNKIKSELAAVIQERDDLQEQVKELTKERDEVVAKAKAAQTTTIEDLMNQLTAQLERVSELEVQNKELQDAIDQLLSGYEAVTKVVKQTREPDVIFVPTPQDVVDKMLELVKIKKDDLVYDLGCGDGRIVVTAAKKFGCKAVGFDIDPQRVKESLANVKKNNVGHLVRIEQKDIFTLDLSKVNVVTLYLLPSLNVKLIPQLKKLKPGSRIVSHDFAMKGVKPDKVVKLTSKEDESEHDIYLWTTPLNQEDTETEEEASPFFE